MIPPGTYPPTPIGKIPIRFFLFLEAFAYNASHLESNYKLIKFVVTLYYDSSTMKGYIFNNRNCPDTLNIQSEITKCEGRKKEITIN
jgi:hypothetical protein